jgi:methyltransferase (TIGR00027 family)
MHQGQPSRSALGAALHRAAHQLLEQGRIFHDPLALSILGADAEAAIRHGEDSPFTRALRLFIAVRTRFAEDALAAAIARGVRQLVVLGAGLDTYAYRCTQRDLHIFEVDHPATQAWKQHRLTEAAIATPPNLTFTPVDFEQEPLADGLRRTAFDFSRAAFFTWLGVVPYLTEQSVFSTLGFIAQLPKGSQVVFDYANPPDSDRGHLSSAREALAARVASIGESFRSHFETDGMKAKLTALSFGEIEDLGATLIRQRYFPGARSPLSDRGGHILRAGTV